MPRFLSVVLCTKGPSDIVLEAAEAVLRVRPQIMHEVDGVQTTYTYTEVDSKWEDSYQGLKAAVETFHDRGARFCLSYHSAEDYGLWKDLQLVDADREQFKTYKHDLFDGSFGEFYTEQMPHPVVRCGGDDSFVETGEVISTIFVSRDVGRRVDDGPIRVVVNKRLFLGDDREEFLTDDRTIISFVPQPWLEVPHVVEG